MSLGNKLKQNISETYLAPAPVDEGNLQVVIFINEIIETVTETIMNGKLPERISINSFDVLKDFQAGWAEFKYRDEFDILRNWCKENELSYRFTSDMQDNYYLHIAPKDND